MRSPINSLGVVVCVTLGLLLAALPARAAPERLPRYLLLCLDGVGYDVAQELYRRGELRHLRQPVPLIASFPTLTNLGLVEAMTPIGAPLARGYEDYYFDRAANRMRGGFFDRFSQKRFVDGSFRELFHYHPHPIGMTLEYALPFLGPWVSGHVTLGRIKRRFLASDAPVFWAYLDSTDPGAHLLGRWFLRDVLRAVDTLAGELRRRDPTVEIIVFSDHGNDFTRFRKADLETPLRRAGFRVDDHLGGPESIVIPRYGLVSAAVLYTWPGQEPAVAEALAGVEGVDLVAWRTPEAVHLLSARGRACIRRRDAGFRYEPGSGDPLDLLAVVGQLPADPDGYIHENDWLAATADHVYPDPLRRLWDAFEGLVARPASLIVSLADGYYTGSSLLDLFAVLRATHGNLRRGQSLGFAVSTAAPLADETVRPVLRLRDLWEEVNRLRERAAAVPERPCLVFLRLAHAEPLLPRSPLPYPYCP